MRNLTWPPIDRFRQKDPETLKYLGGNPGGPSSGFFNINGPKGRPLRVMASSGHGWDHVSVGAHLFTPGWDEMEFIKRLFFKPEEYCFQAHPPLKEYITGDYPGGNSLFVLHIWRPTEQDFPKPPSWMVGANSKEEFDQCHERYEASIKERAERAAANYAGALTLFNALKTARELATDPEQIASIEGGLQYMHQVLQRGKPNAEQRGGSTQQDNDVG
jgi:hypothetical protein